MSTNLLPGKRLVALAAIPALLAGSPVVFAAQTLKGAAILDHPCGKTAARQMSLLHEGKVDEANRLSTKAVQAQWQSMPDKDRKMMADMSKAMSPSGDQYSDAIRKTGVLTVDGNNAVLTVSQTKRDANGSSTSTTTQKLAMEGGQCLVSR
jgi:hypothetical protein